MSMNIFQQDGASAHHARKDQDWCPVYWFGTDENVGHWLPRSLGSSGAQTKPIKKDISYKSDKYYVHRSIQRDKTKAHKSSVPDNEHVHYYAQGSNYVSAMS